MFTYGQAGIFGARRRHAEAAGVYKGAMLHSGKGGQERLKSSIPEVWGLPPQVAPASDLAAPPRPVPRLARGRALASLQTPHGPRRACGATSNTVAPAPCFPGMKGYD